MRSCWYIEYCQKNTEYKDKIVLAQMLQDELHAEVYHLALVLVL